MKKNTRTGPFFVSCLINSAASALAAGRKLQRELLLIPGRPELQPHDGFHDDGVGIPRNRQLIEDQPALLIADVQAGRSSGWRRGCSCHG